MTYQPPTPPSELPPEIVRNLNASFPERLRNIASYAEELAEHKERENRLAEESAEEGVGNRPESLPSDVPSKASITIKEINNNRYYYWQWREGKKWAQSTNVPSIRRTSKPMQERRPQQSDISDGLHENYARQLPTAEAVGLSVDIQSLET